LIDVRKWLRSFRYAYDGIKYALDTQQNMKFHFFVSFAVLLLALLLHLPYTDVLLLLLSITLVVVAELINTAIEQAVDLAMPERHPGAKIAKDVAAAAVLVTAVFAVVVGMTVFYRPIDEWFRYMHGQKTPMSAGVIGVLLAIVVFSVIVIETRFSDRGKLTRPSLFAAIAFAVSTLIMLLSWNTLIFLLSFSLSFLVILVMYDKKGRTLPSLLLGALIGVTITVVSFYLANL
jgi:undecaprenol kinase/diacylglycerol kinase (ATP)